MKGDRNLLWVRSRYLVRTTLSAVVPATVTRTGVVILELGFNPSLGPLLVPPQSLESGSSESGTGEWQSPESFSKLLESQGAGGKYSGHSAWLTHPGVRQVEPDQSGFLDEQRRMSPSASI